MKDKLPEFKYDDLCVKISDITVHPRIQRKFDPNHADRILQKFDPAILRPLAIIKNGNGPGYLLIDGQHSLWAVKQWLGKGYEDQTVQGRLYKTTDDAQAAQLCDRLNSNVKKWTALDKFLNLVTAKDRAATNIVALLATFELKIPDRGHKTDGYVVAVGALQSLYDRDDGRLLKSVLTTIHSAWGKNADGYDGTVLHGVALFLTRYRDQIDLDAFVRKLAKNMTPETLIGDARATARLDRISMRNACCVRLAREYNVGLRTNRLEL